MAMADVVLEGGQRVLGAMTFDVDGVTGGENIWEETNNNILN